MMIGTMQIPLGTVPQFGLLQDIILYGTEPHALLVFTEMETVYNGNLGAYELMALAEYMCCNRVASDTSPANVSYQSSDSYDVDS